MKKKKKKQPRTVKERIGENALKLFMRNQDLFREEHHRACDAHRARRSRIQESDPGFDDIVRAYEDTQ